MSNDAPLTFFLSITLDSDHMQTGDDVQRALALTGADIANRYDGLTLPNYLSGPIHDSTGQQVGTWNTGERLSAENIAATVSAAMHGHYAEAEPSALHEAAERAVRIARNEGN